MLDPWNIEYMHMYILLIWLCCVVISKTEFILRKRFSKIISDESRDSAISTTRPCLSFCSALFVLFPTLSCTRCYVQARWLIRIAGKIWAGRWRNMGYIPERSRDFSPQRSCRLGTNNIHPEVDRKLFHRK